MSKMIIGFLTVISVGIVNNITHNVYIDGLIILIGFLLFWWWV